jgi:hypothetical protein
MASSGTNTYNGTTTINSGKYMLNGTHVTSGPANVNSTAYTINGSATLGGTGTVNTGTIGINTVSLNGTATLAPGDSTQAVSAQTGTLDLNVTAVAFASGTTYAVQIGGNTAGDGVGKYDQVNVTNVAGTVTLTGTVNLTLSLVNSFAPSFSDKFFILNRADAVAYSAFFSGAGEGATVNLGGGYSGLITYVGDSGTNSLTGGNDILIYNVTAVPEPPQYAAAIMGVLGMVIYFRNRRRRNYGV